MELSTMWWIAVIAMLILELLSGTIYLLMLALGLAAGALAAHAGAGFQAQLVIAAGVGAGAVTVWHLLRKRRPAAGGEALNLDVGHVLLIAEWGPQNQASVRYRGAEWMAVLKPGCSPAADGRYRVAGIEGSSLLVEPAPQA